MNNNQALNLSNHYRDQILQVFAKPQFCAPQIKHNYQSITMTSSVCSDVLEFGFEMVQNRIHNLQYVGQACIISTVVAEIVFKHIRSLTRTEAIFLLYQFRDYLRGKQIDASVVHELVWFQNLRDNHPRSSCALAPITTILYFLENLSSN